MRGAPRVQGPQIDPVSASALIAGGASLLGGAWSNATNLGESKRARQWSATMAGSAYQRAVIDMRAAGINPMLAFQQGGAQTPGAATAQVQDAISPAVSSAQHARRLHEELNTMRDQQALLHSERLKKDQERLTEVEFTQPLIAAQTRESEARTAADNVNRLLREFEIPSAQAAARAASGRFGTATGYIQRLRESLFGGGGVGSLIGGAIGGAGGAALGRFRGRGATAGQRSNQGTLDDLFPNNRR